MMTKDETLAAIVAATEEYKATCADNTARLLKPVRAEITRLNAAARKVKDTKVKKLNAWIGVLDAGAVPEKVTDD